MIAACLHRRPLPCPALHDIHGVEVAVAVLVLDEHGQIVRVGARLHGEGDVHSRPLALHTGILDLDGAGASQLAVLAGLCHGTKRCPTHVEVHLIIWTRAVRTFVGDDNRHRVTRASIIARAHHLIARTTALAGVVDGRAASGNHGGERWLVDSVLVPTRATVTSRTIGCTIPRSDAIGPTRELTPELYECTRVEEKGESSDGSEGQHLELGGHI